MPSASVFIATGCGVGLLSPAPGTVGALLGLAWAWGLTSGDLPAWAAPWAWASVPLGVLLGVPLCGYAARELGGKDPAPVVWDEIATVPIVFALTPSAGVGLLLAGFVLHRVVDIAKPWPCRRLERLPGGWGIMADDVAAAAYAALVLWAGRLLAAP